MVTSSPRVRPGTNFADGVVEFELAVLLEKQDGGGGELFGDRADGVAHFGRGWLVGSDVRAAVGMGVDELSAFARRRRLLKGRCAAA